MQKSWLHWALNAPNQCDRKGKNIYELKSFTDYQSSGQKHDCNTLNLMSQICAAPPDASYQ